MRLARHDLSVDLQPGWDVRIFRRPSGEGDVAHSVLHAATVRMPPDRGDYGSGVVTELGDDDAFVALVEFGADAASSALFSARGLPTISSRDFAPTQLHRVVPGQSGYQTFFRVHRRAFSLYVVLGAHSRRLFVVPRVRHLLDTIQVAV